MGVTSKRIRSNRNRADRSKAIAEFDQRGVASDKTPPVAKKGRAVKDPTICQRCGAVYTRKVWRREKEPSHALVSRAAWAVCPACEQVASGVYFGRVLVEGAFVRPNEDAIRARIDNVAGRAEFTQPERRVVEVSRVRGGLEVMTTSQKLAHRIAHELKKAFRGRVTYAWSDRDGSLFARWRRDDEEPKKKPVRPSRPKRKSR